MIQPAGTPYTRRSIHRPPPIMNDRGYLSLLSTDDFLPGLLVLHHSLRKTGTRLPFLVLVTTQISQATLRELDMRGIATRQIANIPVPQGTFVNETRWLHAFTKLRIFEQTQFRKAVYLDADMLVCSNIDELFNHPHMSAVNAGGRLRRHAHWTSLNSGLLVIEPDTALFASMRECLGKIDDHGQGDQGFLHSFYPDWPERPELHLDHRFNQLHLFLDDHRWRFGYRVPKISAYTSGKAPHPKQVKVIHYITANKPWSDPAETRRKIRTQRWFQPQMTRALELWLRCYDEALVLHHPIHQPVDEPPRDPRGVKGTLRS